MAGRGRSKRHRTTPDAVAERVGARIRLLREEADFSFVAFVEATGLGRGYLSELERGLVVPTVGKLQQVADALDLTIADLVIGDSLREQVFEATRGLTNAELRALLRQLGGP